MVISGDDGAPGPDQETEGSSEYRRAIGLPTSHSGYIRRLATA